MFKLEASFLVQMACIGPLNRPGVVGKLVFDITQLSEHPNRERRKMQKMT